MPLPTTRRGRFLYRRERYARRYRRYMTHCWRWQSITPIRTVRNGLKYAALFGVKQDSCGVSSASYDAEMIFPPGGGVSFVISPAGRAMPPHITITSAGYLAARAAGNHQNHPLKRYHAKRYQVVRRNAVNVNNARNRQITGANFAYYFQQCFPDWDVLGRHPTETEVALGAPLGPPGWPVPLGY